MVRLRHILVSIASAIRDVRPAWQHSAFRTSVAVACTLLGTALLFVCCPLGAGRPIVDVAGGIAQVVSAMLDAIGIIHDLDADGAVLSQPGLSFAVADVVGVGGSLAVALLVTLVCAAGSRPSLRHFASLSLGAVGGVFIANILTLFVAAVLGSTLGIDLSAGMGAVLAFLLRVGITVAWQLCLIRVVDSAAAMWRFRQAVRNVDVDDELPAPVTQDCRREIAVIVGCLIGVTGLWLAGQAQTAESLITTYRDVSEQSLNAGDLPTAAIAIERLMQLDALAPAHRFLQAKLLESRGDIDAAECIVRELVRGGGREFGPAHRWLADYIANSRAHLNPTNNAAADQSVSHLTTATDLDPTNINAHIALAETYLARRSPQQAIRELEQVVDERPDLRLTLARLCVIAGQSNPARLHGELAREFYEAEVASYPLAVEPRMRLAASLLFLEEFTQATSVLLKGWEQSADETYRQALGTTYLVWHNALARQNGEKSERLTLLEKSLSYAPHHPETLRQIALLATEEQRSGPAIDLLTRAVADGPIPASVHFILGTNAYRHGRVANALRHLEEAHRLDPHNIETLNNLAIALAEAEPPQLERARELADEAVQRNPNLATIRETRGQILGKLEHWSLAVADLENAMQVMRGNPKIHATLAEAYSHLGDETLASEHRRLAAELATVE